MRLYAKVLPEYFDMLDYKTSEFRQFEDITLENTETHEKRTFKILGIRQLHDFEVPGIKKSYPKASWIPKLPIFSIGLGDGIVSVQVPLSDQACCEDRKIAVVHPAEEKKPWYVAVD